MYIYRRKPKPISKSKNCKVLLQPTPEAIHVFNRSTAKKIGLFHVTC